MHQRGKRPVQKFVHKRGETPRITNVDQLPDEILQKIYLRPERDERGLNRWVRAQATRSREANSPKPKAFGKGLKAIWPEASV